MTIVQCTSIHLDDIKIKPVTNAQEFEEACAIIDALVDADLIAVAGACLTNSDQIFSYRIPAQESRITVRGCE